MSDLKARLVRMIQAHGPITVHDFMAQALYDPQDGYYTTREPFGRSGDFITAPEVSQMFGELVGAWLVAAWRQIGSPASPLIAEIGPGRGTLMKDVARTISRLAPDLSATASFCLIEASDRLKSEQAQTLADMSVEFRWYTSVDELPEKPLLIVGNELFDAIPVHQYVKTDFGWREAGVNATESGELAIVATAGSLDASLLPPGADSEPIGAVFEAAPARSAVMQMIATHVDQHGGAGLFFDYGHLASGFGDTLQAVRNHAYDAPLANPGEADLSSHVDFAALAHEVRAAGLAPYLANQGDFLLSLGLLERAGALGANAGEDVRERITSEVNRLAGPDQMGNLFRVIGFTSGNAPPPGFTPQN